MTMGAQPAAPLLLLSAIRTCVCRGAMVAQLGSREGCSCSKIPFWGKTKSKRQTRTGTHTQYDACVRTDALQRVSGAAHAHTLACMHACGGCDDQAAAAFGRRPFPRPGRPPLASRVVLAARPGKGSVHDIANPTRLSSVPARAPSTSPPLPNSRQAAGATSPRLTPARFGTCSVARSVVHRRLGNAPQTARGARLDQTAPDSRDRTHR